MAHSDWPVHMGEGRNWIHSAAHAQGAWSVVQGMEMVTNKVQSDTAPQVMDLTLGGLKLAKQAGVDLRAAAA